MVHMTYRRHVYAIIFLSLLLFPTNAHAQHGPMPTTEWVTLVLVLSGLIGVIPSFLFRRRRFPWQPSWSRSLVDILQVIFLVSPPILASLIRLDEPLHNVSANALFFLWFLIYVILAMITNLVFLWNARTGRLGTEVLPLNEKLLYALFFTALTGILTAVAIVPSAFLTYVLGVLLSR